MAATKSNQWMVTVTISGNNRLGVDADWSDGKTLYIKAILAGAVSDWNKENPTKSVQPGDRVISVNGVSGDAQAMVREIKDRSLLQLLFQKGEEKERTAEPDPVPVPGVVRAGMPVDIPGMPPRTVDVLLELRARAAEKAAAAKGTTPKAVAKPSNEPPNHYEVLGIDLRADDAAIKKSYRKLVLQWHPDKNPSGREEADVKIRQINLAYETISNPLKRQSYDQMLQALERRRLNIRLETQFIKPRMSIPKEFMLCPLGYSDKFVRIVDNQLLVQSRDEALGVGFQEFFQAAKFSLWWLPEVNNMCRLRARETAGQGMEGGINVSFQFQPGQEEDEAAESGCDLSADQEMKRCNLIVSASPFSQGAFRFEAAFWPERYMAYRTPDQLRMAGKVDEGGDVADFVLVDFSAAYKYMTTSEVLKGAVESQGGGQGGFVKLSDLRADLSVRLYFQQMLGSTVWNNKDFETFFEGHYEEWDFDVKKSRVRMRPDGPLLRQAPAQTSTVSNGGDQSPVPMDTDSSGLAEKLSNSPSQMATVKLLLDANGDDLARLRHGAAVPTLSRLAEKSSHLAADKQKDLMAARRRFLITLPVLLGEGVFSKRDKRREAALPMSTLLGMQKDVASIDKADVDRELVSACQGAVESISELIGGRVRHAPEEVSLEVLPELLSLPLNWRAVAEPLADALSPLIKHQKPGILLQPLRTAAKLAKAARPIVEVLAGVEMKGIAYADGTVAAEILLALAENNLEIANVASKLRPPLLQRLPLPDLVSIVAALGEQGLKDDLLRPPLQARVAVAGPGLATVPPSRLLRLATASTRSACIAECALGPVAGAAAQSLESWTAEDVAELMLLVATSAQNSANSLGAKRLFSRVTEVLTSRLSALSATVLLKVVVAAGAAAAHCRDLLEAAANKAVLKGAEMKPEQVMLLTQGVLPLGGSHPVVIRLLNFWAQLLAGSDNKAPVLPPDDIAQLAMLLSMVAPDHSLVFHVIGTRLQEVSSSLTEAGYASLEAAFPDGAGPAFPGKEQLLAAAAEIKAKKAEAKKAEAEKAEAKKEASKSRANLVPRRDRSRSRRSPRTPRSPRSHRRERSRSRSRRR
ncbi:Dnajb8 [Symbiodinium natans]|uniref:Dnajb8 protein n=1 Tax=Symbiodinium natans TaxID=878477 RepID=A0A812L0N0_9DINO|nr:Dnajb8 [Symbiodinium natans]